jgi:hypothetical protein
MDKRKWETPKTRALNAPAQALGACEDGSTADQVVHSCTQGTEAFTQLEPCYSGGVASGRCSVGQTAIV